MEKKRKNAPSEELMRTVYRNAKMGSEAISAVIGRAGDAHFREELTGMLESHYGFETAAENKLTEMSAEAKAPGMLEKLPAELSIRMSTMLDSSDSKIAEIMIGGYSMGLVDLQRSINRARAQGVGDDVMNIAEGACAFGQVSIEKMKKYL